MLQASGFLRQKGVGLGCSGCFNSALEENFPCGHEGHRAITAIGIVVDPLPSWEGRSRLWPCHPCWRVAGTRRSLACLTGQDGSVPRCYSHGLRPLARALPRKALFAKPPRQGSVGVLRHGLIQRTVATVAGASFSTRHRIVEGWDELGVL